MKILVIFGTRPEAIKLAPVIQELRKYPDFETIVVVTAQHRELLDQVLHLFNIIPDYDLDIMQPAQSVFDVTSRALLGLRPVLEQEHPDLVLVQGDTTTVMAAALAAFYLRIPIGHIEAGLRSGDKYQPFPEEINRRLTTVLADWHFAPTERARQALLHEGIPDERIHVTGNTVIDALLSVVRRDYTFSHPVLRQLDFESRRVLLATTHRRENWGKPMQRICMALRTLVDNHPETELVLSVHPNPAVRGIVEKELRNLDRVHLVDALDYESFVHLMARCYLILSDSGGVQEEAPSLNRPVLVLREVTERPEGVEVGALELVGTDPERIVAAAERLLSDSKAYARMAAAPNPYGDGRASERIVRAIQLWQTNSHCGMHT